MAEDLGERTEDATPRKLQNARDEGNVAKSGDLAGAVMLLGVTLLLWAGLMPSLGSLKVYLGEELSINHIADLIVVEASADAAASAFMAAVMVAGPLLCVAWLVAWLSHFMQVGWLFTTKPLEPKLSKLNPISGLKRVVGIAAVVKAGMDSSKVAVVCIVVVISITGMMNDLVALPGMTMMQALGAIGWMMFDLALRILAVLLFLGILDLAYQRWKHQRDLRMSRTEVKDEMRQTEGDPETRKRRMRMQQQIAMQRLRSDVPKADVIVTNPEHISIAIQYDADSMHAPKVVAKGQEYVALRIRQIALMHGIPIVERKPLARMLFRTVKVGQEVPPSVYQAIAEVLAYVYRLRGKVPRVPVTSR
ncbi:MAG: flagellar biosynthesis protein FlhB [Phycisphaerales bacterium]